MKLVKNTANCIMKRQIPVLRQLFFIHINSLHSPLLDSLTWRCQWVLMDLLCLLLLLMMMTMILIMMRMMMMMMDRKLVLSHSSHSSHCRLTWRHQWSPLKKSEATRDSHCMTHWIGDRAIYVFCYNFLLMIFLLILNLGLSLMREVYPHTFFSCVLKTYWNRYDYCASYFYSIIFEPVNFEKVKE